MIELVLQSFEGLQPRILFAIISEIIMFSIAFFIGISIYKRYTKNKTIQTLFLSYTYLFYTGGLVSSTIGKILHYIFSYEINKTELGIFTNWSMPLVFMVMAVYFQFLFNYEISRPKNKRKMIIIQRWIALSIIILFISIPRYFMGNELKFSNPIKFTLIFGYVSWACIYYIKFSLKIYSFSEIEPLLIRVKYSSIMYGLEIIYFIILLISQIYGTITGIFYGYLYYFALIILFFVFIFGYLGTKSYSQEDIDKIQEMMNEEKIV